MQHFNDDRVTMRKNEQALLLFLLRSISTLLRLLGAFQCHPKICQINDIKPTPSVYIRIDSKVGIPRGDEFMINIGRFSCFIAGNYQTDHCHEAKQ